MMSQILSFKPKTIVFTLLLLTGSLSISLAQNTIEISGSCVENTVVLSEANLNDGRLSYTGTGTIFGFGNTKFAIWWDATESKWLLGLDGQPYWYSSYNTDIPNSTLLTGDWDQADLSQGTCNVIIQGSGTNMPASTSIKPIDNTINKIYSSGSVLYINLINTAKSKVSAYDLSGHKVKELYFNEPHVKITDLPQGTYIIKLNTEGENITQKVLIK